jgi:hypothetical protein
MRSPTDRTEITRVDLELGIGGVRLHTQKKSPFHENSRESCERSR